jgi:hypothetical protein
MTARGFGKAHLAWVSDCHDIPDLRIFAKLHRKKMISYATSCAFIHIEFWLDPDQFVIMHVYFLGRIGGDCCVVIERHSQDNPGTRWLDEEEFLRLHR